MVMILSADSMYDKTFQTFRCVWRKGYQCRVAGYLLMMSLQVSSLMMVLLVGGSSISKHDEKESTLP